MSATIAMVPRFRKGQTVSFIGGSGTIKSYYLEAGNWFYLVEMEMGPEPAMGRIGAETTVLLSQSDLIVQEEHRALKLPISA
ncbi:hypothetical protein NDI45_20350 [Leptolyngbya sp. GB1-A1]|uniref:hypothetical protein n=1 Tax=Leptolyngbya sp. GB1-A1 TaxID=2933908 RepID=UPI003299D15A